MTVNTAKMQFHKYAQIFVTQVWIYSAKCHHDDFI